MNSGAFGENFPYSNFHDLNMDWIIKIAKDFLDQYTTIQQIISDGETSLTNLTESGLEQLQNKADTLEQLLQEWYDTHSNDIANQLASALQDLNSWYNEHQNYLDQTLIDNLTTFNQRAVAIASETIESIPTDYTELFNQVQDIAGGSGLDNYSIMAIKTDFIKVSCTNLLDPQMGVRIRVGKAYNPNTGVWADNASYKTSEMFPVKSSHRYYAQGEKIMWFRSDKTYIGQTSIYPTTTPVASPANSTYPNDNAAYAMLEMNVSHTSEDFFYDSNADLSIADYKLTRTLNPELMLENSMIKELYNNKLIANIGDIYKVTDIATYHNCNHTKGTKWKFNDNNIAIRPYSTSDLTDKSYIEIELGKTYTADELETIGLMFYIDGGLTTYSSAGLREIHMIVYDGSVYQAEQGIYYSSVLVNGWNFLQFHKNEFTFGTISAFNKLKVQFTPINDFPANTAYARIIIDTVIVNMKMKPIVLISHDAMWQDSLTNGVYDKYRQSGVAVTIFDRNWDSVDPTLKSLAINLTRNYASAMCLYGSYGNNNQIIQTGTDYLVMQENANENKAKLQEIIDYDCKAYSCSQGVLNPLIKAVMNSIGIKVIRYGATYQPRFIDKDINCIGYLGVYESTTLANVKEVIDNAVNYGRVASIFTHAVTTDGGTTQAKLSVWNDMIDYISSLQAQGKLTTMTFQEIADLI